MRPDAGMDMDMETAAVEVRALRHSYGATRALDGVDLVVRTGEALAVLGPNGAGKSTLIGILLGLIAPTSGQARIHGRPPQAAARAGLLAAMLQGADLPAFATVGEVVTFIARLYPHPLAVQEAARMAGVTDLMPRPVRRLSGGQRRRVQFAMALVAAADLLFLDEPTEGMDIEGRGALWQTVRAQAGADRTVVFTTHDLSEADRFADRIALLSRGRVIAVDTPDALKATLSKPRLRFDAPPGVTASEIGARLGRPVRAHDAGFELVADDTDDALRALLDLGMGLSRFETVQPTLDEVFQNLVAREGGDNGDLSAQ